MGTIQYVIEPRRRLRLLAEIAEVWRYRELLWVMVRRDLNVRYKETLFGAAWAVLQPLALMLVFWLALGRVMRVATEVPYPLFVLSGLLPWTFFAGVIAASTGSMLASSQLIQKVYFPRMIIPLSTIGVHLADFGVGLIVLLGFVAWAGYLDWGAPAALLPLAGIMLAALAVGTLCAALAAAYRDTRYMIPLVVQVWFFATPVFYPASVLDESVRWLLDVNPMAALVEGFRNGVLGRPVDWAGCGRSVAVFLGLLWLGAWLFTSVQRRVADTL
jgi:lipopolysaccharide transport system permease protein